MGSSRDFIKSLKGENEIPDFLKLNEKGDGLSEYFEDETFATTYMYTEMTLKNTKNYAPRFPIVATPPPPLSEYASRTS